MRISALLGATALTLFSTASYAATTTIAQSALVSSNTYYTNNLGSGVLAANDDGSTGRINLGFNVSFFGQTYNSLYINNNGNLTFNGAVSSYVPTGPTGVSVPIISAWFGDVDTRGAASGLVHYDLDSTNQQLVVTWDQVGYFGVHSDLLNSFQIVLRGDGYALPNGEGQIGFWYKNMDWIRTDTSQLAAVGFGDGAGNAEVLEGSASQANLNTVVANTHIWFDQNLVVVPPSSAVPEPATWAMFIGGFGMVGGAIRRKKASVSFA